MLEPTDVETLRLVMRERIGADMCLLDDIRDELKDFKRNVKAISPYSSNTISIVGTDGGNNNLKFDPFVVHVIRVVDSNNVEYYMDVITPTMPIDQLDNKIRGRNDALKRMMDFLGVDSITKLSHVIKYTKPAIRYPLRGSRCTGNWWNGQRSSPW